MFYKHLVFFSLKKQYLSENIFNLVIQGSNSSINIFFFLGKMTLFGLTEGWTNRYEHTFKNVLLRIGLLSMMINSVKFDKKEIWLKCIFDFNRRVLFLYLNLHERIKKIIIWIFYKVRPKFVLSIFLALFNVSNARSTRRLT